MAKSSRRMRHRSRRHHRGGMAALAPASIDGMAAAPAGDAMAMVGPQEAVVLGPNDQMALPNWKKDSLAELGFGAGDSNQMGGRRRSRRHSRKGGKRHSRRHSRKGGKRHSRRHSRRHMKKRGGCGCGGAQ